MSYLVTNDMKIGLVIMASGLSKRFGRNKLMEDLGGKPLIQWIFDATDDLFSKRVVVTRNNEVKDLCDRLNIPCIIHDMPNRNDTVRIGLSVLMDDVDYCFFTPGDQPLIEKATMSNLIKVADEHNNEIVRLCFGETEGSPVGFPKSLFEELRNLPEGKGGNVVVKNNPARVHPVMANREYELWDVDTMSDLDKIKSRILPN